MIFKGISNINDLQKKYIYIHPWFKEKNYNIMLPYS